MGRWGNPGSNDLIDTVLARASYVLSLVGGLAVFFMLLQVTANVILRYSLSMPITGTIEITSAYYMPAVIFLPLAAVERGHRHIIVELFTQKLRVRWVAALDAFAAFLGFIYAGCITWSSGAVAVLSTTRFESWNATFFNVPVWPSRWFVPIGCGCLALYMLLHVIKYIRVAIGTSQDRRIW